MSRRSYKYLTAFAIPTLAVLGFSILPAAAADVVDYWGPGVLNGCTVQSAGVNDTSSGQTQVYVYNANTCGKTTCIKEAYVDPSGVARWGSEACTSGQYGQYGIPAAVSGTYLGRQIRVASSCWWDTLFDNPTPHACI